MSTCTSYVPMHIYIADMRTIEVSKLNILSLLNKAFLVKIANSNLCHAHVAWIPLVTVFWGSGVVVAFQASK